jgi:hypothetical protein
MEVSEIALTPVGIMVTCARCGEGGSFEPEMVGGGWTIEQQQELLARYLAAHRAACSDDGALLRFEEYREGGGARGLNATCPACGKSAWLDISSE